MGRKTSATFLTLSNLAFAKEEFPRGQGSSTCQKTCRSLHKYISFYLLWKYRKLCSPQLRSQPPVTYPLNHNSIQFDISQTNLSVSIQCLQRTFQCYLSSNCSILFFWRWRLKDALLLLRRECGIQWNDFDVTDFRAQIINLALYSLTGFINFLQNKS